MHEYEVHISTNALLSRKYEKKKTDFCKVTWRSLGNIYYYFRETG